MFAQDEEDQKPAQDIMTDGIMQIAGGIETIVQQLQLQVKVSFMMHLQAAVLQLPIAGIRLWTL